jgi:uncharacterized damage-inducible protein DinB
MASTALPLSIFYSGWERYNDMLSGMLAPLSPAQLALPASPHHLPIGLIAQHAIANRVWWFQVWMGEGDPALAPIAHWDPADPVEQEPLDAAGLVAGLDVTWQMIADALARWAPSDLDKVFVPPARMSEEERRAVGERTRGWIIWHVFEHEIHHGGELSLALGELGLPGIYGGL